MARWTLGWVMLAALAACAGDEDHGFPEPEPFVLPLSATSADGNLTATLVQAEPAQPSKGANTWILELADAEGQPVDDLEWRGQLFMPEHGHGSSPPTVLATEIDGEYELSRINFIMGGIWEVRIIPAGASADRDVVFHVRVPD